MTPARRKTFLLLTLVAVLTSVALSQVAMAQDATVDEATIRWSAKSGNTAVVTVSGPGDLYLRNEFGAGELPSFSAFDRAGKALPDGVYTWELRYSEQLSAEQKRLLLADRDADPSGQAKVDSPAKQVPFSGYFSILDGRILDPSTPEPADKASPGTAEAPAGASTKQTINGDLTVYNSLCVGFDCPANPNYGSDTIRLQENNLRIHFDDTSGGSFPANDWRIVANTSTNGGLSKFSVDDATNSRTPFTLEARAPNHALYVDDGGRVGFGTSIPVVENHIVSGNSPTLRLEQNGSSGFNPQSWDLVGNETSFFIRDVTNGSTLPFRVRPGAPSQALVIDTDGDVGIGTLTAQDKLHVQGTSASNPGIRIVNPDANGGAGWAFRVVDANQFRISEQSTGLTEMSIDVNGNMAVRGTISSGGVQLNVPDYVFEPDYELMPLDELATFVQENKHLPRIPSAREINGSDSLNMTDMQMRLLEKVEELTLYTIAQDELLKTQQDVIRQLENRLEALEGQED